MSRISSRSLGLEGATRRDDRNRRPCLLGRVCDGIALGRSVSVRVRMGQESAQW
jgi:hypothetical protein